MSVATEVRVMPRGTSWHRVSLWALLVWVLGAAVYFAMVRGATGFWFEGTPGVGTKYLDVYRAIGVGLLAPAVLLATLLIGDLSRRLRPRGEDREPSAFATAWRVGAVAVLVGLGAVASASFADDRSAAVFSVFERSSWKVQLSSLALAIALIGLMLGLVPLREPRAGGRKVRGRWIGASVALAGVAGVLLMAFWPWAPIAYLVLIALDAVNLAKFRPAMMVDAYLLGHPPDPTLVDPRLWRPLTERLATAGLASALALLICGLAVHRLGRDLRRPAAGVEALARRSWAGVAYRLAIGAATWGMGAYLLFVGLPRLDPSLAEGFRDLLNPRWSSIIAVGFLALAAGLAARGVAGSAVPPIDPGRDSPRLPRPRWLAWPTRAAIVLAKLTACVLLAMVIASAVWRLRGGDTLPWFAPFPMSVLVDALGGPFTYSTKTLVYFDPSQTPEALPLVFGAFGLAVLLVRYLLARGDPGRTSPIDRVGRDRLLIGRFLGAWLTISGAILAAMPAFALAGIAVLHFTMMAYYR